MNRILLLVVALASVATSQIRIGSWDPANARRAVVDTIMLDSSETKYSQCFWVCAGGNYSLMLEVNDTSAAGFASDSAVASIEVLQAFNVDQAKYALFPSHAHPDSDTVAFAGGANFYLSDSLDIRSMQGDTLRVFSRATRTLKDAQGNTVDNSFTDDVGAAYSSALKARIGALRYYSFAVDYSPGVVLKIKGLTGNKKGGPGSRWIVRWYQQVGQPMQAR
jgi:hypothetical protein